jgi:hypothetical protein
VVTLADYWLLETNTHFQVVHLRLVALLQLVQKIDMVLPLETAQEEYLL